MMKRDHNTHVVTYYNDPNVAEYWKNQDKLGRVEAVLLARVKEELQDQPILDIGIGGGRTTPYLRQISKVYTGIDFSEAMIQAAGPRFPAVDFFTCDARDLSRFQNGQFAAVFFFGPGIDYVSGADRLLILKEISRVLRARGIFILTGHNLEAHFLSALAYRFRFCSNQRIFVADNLLRLRTWISHCKGALWSIIHYKGYAVFMDYNACGAVLLTYYMRRSAQIRQLIENGFSEVEAIDEDGNIINDDKATKSRRVLHYIARKKG
jgi:SAM-dependent methyltransferase